MNVAITITFENNKLLFTPETVTIPIAGASVYWVNLDNRGDEKGKHWITSQGACPTEQGFASWLTPPSGPQLPEYTDPESGAVRSGNTPTVYFSGNVCVQYWCALDQVAVGTIVVGAPVDPCPPAVQPNET